MATANPAFDNLAAGYLFPEISKRTKKFLQENPGTEILRLGIGDTTEPLPPAVIKGLIGGVKKLSHADTYSGYGDDSSGIPEFKGRLVKRYASYGVSLDPDEVFVSDGAKPDSANIQSIFGLDNIVAVQDPAYPVYVDSNIMAGRGGKFSQGRYEGLVYMPCTEENDFFPSLPGEKVDIIYLCSPNNPTGCAASREQLKQFVDYAIQRKAVIIFDAAYSVYISDNSLPRSIFEVENAKQCAIEINSFSKEAGFTGVRLGWSVVPKDLVAENAGPGKLNSLWARRQNTMFNGASNIVQNGGIAVMSGQGQKECRTIIDYYMENARIIRAGLQEIGIKVFGGTHAPYIWMQTPGKMDSWAFFDKLLTQAHVVGTPGSGFGPGGQGYFRLSAFGHRENIKKAVTSIRENLVINATA
jgi:LL-diaminopimelate aminotransferase